MEFQVQERDGAHVVVFSGPITRESADTGLRTGFKQLLASGAKRIVFDLREVPYMDSAGIGETVGCVTRANERQASLKLVLQPGGKPDQMIRLAALDRILELFDDVESAVADFSR
jgi:anti-anti-sigma factor